MTDHSLTNKDRVVSALARGPATVATMEELLGCQRNVLYVVCSELAKSGLIERIGKDGRQSIYALRAGRKAIRRHDAAKLEATYIAARHAGERAPQLAQRLDLTPFAAKGFERAYRYQTASGTGNDNSCPKFADHVGHLAAVWLAEGFPAWSESRGPRGRVVACPPLRWPQVGA